MAERVEVDTGRGTLTITGPRGSGARFNVAVGSKKNPTPARVTGYIEERYADPTQSSGATDIQLTSLHATRADEPYRGHDGGLIGIHFSAMHAGRITHGCIRVDSDTLRALNALPRGTLVITR
ncbi:L,D-transpeptidase [Curtobacterium sp. VKM Ac-2852]|nr:L,D-transpeptidase [Curtobacterium sp. VKM Ac-2852]